MPLWGYDQAKHEKGSISRTENWNRTKYVKSFEMVNLRSSSLDKVWKFERICMLLVDFEHDPPLPIIGLPEKSLDPALFPGLDVTRVWKCLDYKDFFKDLVGQARKRYPECIPTTHAFAYFRN